MDFPSAAGITPVMMATLIIFIVVYFGLAMGHWFFLKLDRTGIVLLGAILMRALGCITLPQAVAAVNVESLLLLFALMVIAAQLHCAGFYGWIANTLFAGLLDRPAVFLAVLIAACGVLAAFLNNDVVVIAVAPVLVGTLAEKKLNPVPFLIALALSANIGCALTFIGNAQNVLIGEIGKVSFGGYMLFAAVPVALSLFSCYMVVYFLGRKSFALPASAMGTQNAATQPPGVDAMSFNRLGSIKGITTLTIVIGLFVFTSLPHYLIALAGAGFLLCSHTLSSRKMLSLVNWQLMVLFTGLFVVVGAFDYNGLSDSLLHYVASSGIDINNPIELAAISGVLSNCINNSAAVMLLVKVADLSNPVNCYALAISNAFAGNLLIVGSMAGIIAVQSAERLNLKIGFCEYSRFGAPTAIISMAILLAWIRLIG